MLASDDAVRRKGARAVYRTLRVQISRFEEAFVQLHGRRPKGAIEKAPLATTYAQYREWKRAIRSDAARRIQALFRGTRTRARTRTQLSHIILRKMNQTKNHPHLPKLVEARAGKSGFTGLQDDNTDRFLITDAGVPLALYDEIRAPAEMIGDHNRSDEEDDPLSNSDRDAPSTEEADISIPPSLEDGDSPNFEPLDDDLVLLSLPELRARKHDLKEELKEFDVRFTIEHGRMPNKAEKEPIRHLYDRYNELKDLIGANKTVLVSEFDACIG